MSLSLCNGVMALNKLRTLTVLETATEIKYLKLKRIRHLFLTGYCGRSLIAEIANCKREHEKFKNREKNGENETLTERCKPIILSTDSFIIEISPSRFHFSSYTKNLFFVLLSVNI